jgi:predicted O-methyltransferase YrrM
MKKYFLNVIIYFGLPFTFLSSLWFKFLRKVEGKEINDRVFMKVGIFPVLDHYYEPLINPKKHLYKSLREDRNLPGINFNIEEQLELLDKFDYNGELLKFPIHKQDHKFEFFYNNGSYCSGDAEYLYNIIRHFKPSKIIEIGSGNSTLMAKNAILKNKQENENYTCKHTCIEPYEQAWLEECEIDLIRERIEFIDKNIFRELGKNDILFIDSSHIIRPQGDVLFEYLEILPILKSGVLIHVHDIFTPRDYLNEWVYKHFLWNEQYLLEAFLSFNNEFKIIGSLNYLSHNYRNNLALKCPVFAKQEGREPGSIWIVRK